MGFLNSMMADDAARCFNSADENTEACTYKPHGSTNTVSVNLSVQRHAPEVPPESGRGRTWNITVFLAANTNIASINTQGDRVTIAPTYGGIAQDLAVVEILNQSPAGWTLLLR